MKLRHTFGGPYRGEGDKDRTTPKGQSARDKVQSQRLWLEMRVASRRTSGVKRSRVDKDRALKVFFAMCSR